MRTRTKAYRRALLEANKAFVRAERAEFNPEVLAVIIIFPIVAIPLLLFF